MVTKLITLNDVETSMIAPFIKKIREPARDVVWPKDKDLVLDFVERTKNMDPQLLYAAPNVIYDPDLPIEANIPNINVAMIYGEDGVHDYVINHKFIGSNRLGVMALHYDMLPGISMYVPINLGVHFLGEKLNGENIERFDEIIELKEDESNMYHILSLQDTWALNMGQTIYDRGIVADIRDENCEQTGLGKLVNEASLNLVTQYGALVDKEKEDGVERGTYTKEQSPLVKSEVRLRFSGWASSIYMLLGYDDTNIWHTNDSLIPQEGFTITNDHGLRPISLWMPDTPEIQENLKKMAASGPSAGYGPVFDKMPVKETFDEGLKLYLLRP